MTQEELNKLREKIIETSVFPTVYMFKFIVPSENRSIALVENLFDQSAEIHIKESGRGKYTSVTGKQVVINVEEIIDIYKKASTIEKIMFL
jgi:putative lipoic acid-binding regulatory protein